jgi:RNA polymerase sigma factor (sigma-70 family)
MPAADLPATQTSLSSLRAWTHIARMTRVSDERALWLVRHALPHEAALRGWLERRRLVGLEVDDVVQETYARLIALESVEHVRNSRNYMFQTAHSVLMTHLRRSKVVSFVTVADVEQLGLAASGASPETQVADRDELQRLAEAIASLPAKARDVFVLRRVHGVAQREVARRLGVSESTVEKHMGRSLHMIMEVFGRSGKPTAGASMAAEKEERANHGPRGGTRD